MPYPVLVSPVCHFLLIDTDCACNGLFSYVCIQRTYKLCKHHKLCKHQKLLRCFIQAQKLTSRLHSGCLDYAKCIWLKKKKCQISASRVDFAADFTLCIPWAMFRIGGSELSDPQHVLFYGGRVRDLAADFTLSKG